MNSRLGVWHWILTLTAAAGACVLLLRGTWSVPAAITGTALGAWATFSAYAGLKLHRKNVEGPRQFRRAHLILYGASKVVGVLSVLGCCGSGLILMVDPPGGWGELGLLVVTGGLAVVSVVCLGVCLVSRRISRGVTEVPHNESDLK